MSAPQIQYPPTSGGGAPVGGSGTANTIPRWDAGSPSTTLTDSGLIDNGTAVYTSTRRVGVDTSTTLANVKLQVGTAASLANYQGAPLGVVLPAGSGSWLELAENSASGTTFRISKDSSTGVVLNTNGKTIGFTAAGYTTAVASSQVVLTTSGNVGIGTASPSAQLQVERAGGLSNAEYLRLRNTTSGSGSAVAQDYYVHANTVATGRIQHTWNGTTYDTTLSVWNNSLSSLQEAVRVQGGGNVGIGTASPIGTLDVRATNPTIVCSNSATRYGYQVWNDAASEYRAGTGGSFPFVFLTGNLERARIDSTGNFGIGTASPSAKLEIPSTASLAGIRVQLTAAPKNNYYNAEVHNFRNLSDLTRVAIDTVNNYIDASLASGWGLKLPATPGNADTQTLDAYQEIGTGTPAEIALTLTCGTSGTITVNAASSKARVTRVGNKVIGHGRIAVSSVSAPLGRLSCTLTGCPQPFTFFVCETRTNDTTGVASGNIIVGTSDTSATPIVYFDRYSPNTRNDDAAANIQAGTTIVFSFSYSV